MDLAKVDVIIDRHAQKKGALIAVLQDIQDTFYYLPEEAMRKVSDNMNVPLSRIYSLATFYNAFSLEPRGKNKVCVCLGTTCYVRGGERILAGLKDKLKINEGETTEDKQYTLETVHCLGCCSIAPVMMVNNDTHGRLREEKTIDIVHRY